MKSTFDRSHTIRELKEMRAIKDIDLSPLTPTRTEEDYIFVKDPALGFPFFFALRDLTFQDYKPQYHLVYSPISELNNSTGGTTCEPSKFNDYYSQWLSLIGTYSALQEEFVQDTIIEGYEDEYAEFLEMEDADADTHSFEDQKQRDIDMFLQMVHDRLEWYKTTAELSEDVIEEINVLLKDIERLRSTQNRQTKRQVVLRLRNIYARFRKAVPEYTVIIGKEVVKALLTDGAKDALIEASKEVGKFFLE